MIKPQQTTGQKISSVGGTVGSVLGGINLVKGLFTNKNDEDRRQLKQQGKLQELQIGGSKELADYEQDLKMKMWNDTNYGAQLAQAEKAGVSKAAAIGGGGTGTQGASVGGTTGGQAADAAQTEANAINKQMMMAQVANMTANTAKTVEETKNIAGVDRDGKGEVTRSVKFDNDLKERIGLEAFERTKSAELEKDEAGSRKERMIIETWSRIMDQNEKGDKVGIDNPDSRLFNSLLNEYKKAKSELNLSKAEEVIKRWSTELINDGMPPDSPWYYKLIERFINNASGGKMNLMNIGKELYNKTNK